MDPFDRTPGSLDPTHPPPSQLHAFAVGQIDETSAVEIERHLTECDSCSALLASSPDDAFVALLQGADSATRSEDEPPSSPRAASRRWVPGYQLLEALGEGGMGLVWKAKQEELNRLVALKRIRSSGLESPEALARFRREAEAAARLHHANIVQIYDVGEQDGEPYLALEYVAGGSLAEKLAAGPLQPSAAASLVETLARAMHHAHERGVIHRDLKPSNVFLTEDGSPKIGDFGLAKQLDEATAHTQTGAILGTPSYMAPEQTASEKTAVGPPADVYALGAILYETLTGRPLFRGPSVLDTLAQVREREPVPPRQLQPSVPRDLQTICLKCLHKEPRRRYPSALELADDLRRFAAGEPIRARPVGRSERLLKWMRRQPYQALLALVVLMAPLAVVAGLLWHNRQLHEEIRRAESAEERDRDNYRKARQTIRRMIERLDQWKPANVPEVSKFAEGITQESLDYVETVLSSSTNPDPEVRADAADLLTRIGMNQAYYSRPKQSWDNLIRAAQLWEQLAAEQPDNYGYHRSMLACYRGLAAVAGDDRQKLGYHEKVLALAEELYRLNPDDVNQTTDLAQAHHNLAAFLSSAPRHHLGEEEPHYQRAIELMERVLAKHPEQSGCRLGLADSYGNLGHLYSSTGRPAQAEESFHRADALLEVLMRDDPQHLIYPISRAAVAQNWGKLAVSAGHPEAGISRCERAVEWSEAVLRKEPNLAMARYMALNAHGNLAEACESAGRFKAALPHWDRVIALASGPDQRTFRLRRALVRIKAGDSTQAANDAEAIAKEPGCSPDMSYNCACVFALSGHAGKAVALLSKLRSSGYFDKPDNFKNLCSDKDLDSLRQRDDFAKLVAGRPQ